jgi:hypothetical protein
MLAVAVRQQIAVLLGWAVEHQQRQKKAVALMVLILQVMELLVQLILAVAEAALVMDQFQDLEVQAAPALLS